MDLDYIEYSQNSFNSPLTLSDLADLLPVWKTKILEVFHFKNSDDYELKFLIAANTEAEIKKWLKAYEEKSKCTYSIRSTESCAGARVKFKQQLKCYHNTYHRHTYYDTCQNKRTRNFNCRSKMTITLRAVHKRYQGKDKSRAPEPGMPCEITLIPNHNHSTDSVDILKLRPVSEEVQQKLLTYFQLGHSPSSALDMLKMEIYLNEDNCELKLADRKFCPNYTYCYRLYMKHFKDKHDGPINTTNEYLINRIDQCNIENVKSAQIEFIGDDYVICLVPPLLRRVHENTETAGNIVFMDSTGTVDRDGSRVFILFTPSLCGSLPLALFITSSKSADLISMGFQLLKNLLGDSIFYGNVNGPNIFMTDDSAAEQAAIQAMWPESLNLLSCFHVLRAVWNWLIKSKNNIEIADQQRLFDNFKGIMYAQDYTECEEKYNAAIEDSFKYPNYEQCLKKYWDRKELWAVCFRNYLGKAYDTNISEAAMHILKEKLFERVKAFNLVQLIDFLNGTFVKYHELRLLDAAHNRFKKKMCYDSTEPPPMEFCNEIQSLTDSIHLVPSETENVFYIANTDVLICTCFVGRSGNICKHLYWICYFFKAEDFLKKIDNICIRKKLFYIATGTTPPVALSSLSDSTENDCEESMSITDEEISAKSEENLQPFEDVSCENNDQTVQQEISIVEDSDKISEVAVKFAEIASMFMESSPEEVDEALTAMQNSFKKIKTVSAFVSGCRSFSSEIQKRNKRYRSKTQPISTSPKKLKKEGQEL